MKDITQKLQKALQVQQNSAVRAVKDVELGYPTSSIYTELGIDRLKTLSSKVAVKLVFKGFNSLGTNYLTLYCIS